MVASQALGGYFACLDSDDWWDSNYLESLLTFAQKNHLDIAGTGCVFHVLSNGSIGVQGVQTRLKRNVRFESK